MEQHTQNKNVITRLAKISGHLEAVKKMAAEGRECSELLTQLSAIIGALNGVSRVILEDHISHCLVGSIGEGKQESLDKLFDAVDKYLGTNTKRLESPH
ncbi:MAG: Copper-sensing transcriptional repressor RicR [Firmicutes bacterium]|nr:Copper-sensing transcriptional repressor RicR [Bacillota bacterium]MBT9151870.1 Copper-sensing transcriptional repressor RicR [Bacillota bacterium]MBT9157113.1 Copper-sensing transcriptional repressor RicR [Bacillota bacterium]